MRLDLFVSIPWQQPGNAFRTIEIILKGDEIKTGGQYNHEYAWETLEQLGDIDMPSRIAKTKYTIYGLKGIQIGSDFSSGSH